MRQTGVKFQSKDENNPYSPLGGSVLFDEVFRRFGIDRAVDEHIGARSIGSGIRFTDSDYVKSFVFMQMVGGDTVDDLSLLREDPVVESVLGKIPGRTSCHNYLSSFVDREEELKRGQGKSTLEIWARNCLTEDGKINGKINRAHSCPALGR